MTVGSPAKPATAKVVEINEAVASKIFARWTRPVRERIYRDFLRGVDPIDLRVSYRDPVFGLPKVAHIIQVIREEGRNYKRQAEAGKYAGLIDFPRRAA
jgi:hypothetical protein